MYFVYILQSVNYPEKTYIGFTNNITNRLSVHNDGGSVYASKYKPWRLYNYIVFHEELKAIEFEKYLKSGAGKAFVNKHFL